MNDPVGLAFQERYQTKWDAPAGFSNAGTGYDEVYLLAHAWGVTGDTRNFDANIAELKRNIYRGVSGGYWFGSEEANFCLCVPERDRRTPRSATRTCSSRSSPTKTARCRTRSSTRRRTSRRSTSQPPWLSF